MRRMQGECLTNQQKNNNKINLQLTAQTWPNVCTVHTRLYDNNMKFTQIPIARFQIDHKQVDSDDDDSTAKKRTNDLEIEM